MRQSEGLGMMQKDNRTIAFVCTGNTCRSPMAEAIFNDMAGWIVRKIPKMIIAIESMLRTVLKRLCFDITKPPLYVCLLYFNAIFLYNAITICEYNLDKESLG